MATADAPMPRRGSPKARERIDVRLRAEQKSFIERAASIKGITVTDFILQQALENAQQIIREYDTWTLERPDAELFAEALTNPPGIGPQLTAAAKRYKERFLQP
jgi:uncharacterized protein (DUF1778 family)